MLTRRSFLKAAAIGIPLSAAEFTCKPGQAIAQTNVPKTFVLRTDPGTAVGAGYGSPSACADKVTWSTRRATLEWATGSTF